MAKAPITLSIAAIARHINASEYAVKTHIANNHINPIGYADTKKKRLLYPTSIIKKMAGCKLRKKPFEQPVITTIRLNKKEHIRLSAAAKNNGMTLGKFLKQVASKRKPPPQTVRQIKTADPALLRQIASIGNNLNQLAKSMNAANRKGQVPTGLPTAIFASLCDIEEQLAGLTQ